MKLNQQFALVQVEQFSSVRDMMKSIGMNTTLQHGMPSAKSAKV
jgi:hypothetical protein